MKITNKHNIPIGIAAWLGFDSYDHVDDPSYISATSLLKPTKATILTSRIPSDQRTVDIADLIAANTGTAVHDAIEAIWTNTELLPKVLKSLGYASFLIDRIKVNPTPAEASDCTPVYLEKRTVREIDGMKVGGKFDFVFDGMVQDFKTTSVFTYLFGSKDEDYIAQGSIYRWLNPEIITSNEMAINYIFKDWSATKAMQDPNYPQCASVQKKFRLLSMEDTEKLIRNKIQELKQYKDSSQEDIVPCTDKDLWRSPPKYKYYKDPTKLKRATKNFDDPAQAYMYMSQQGNKGTVIEVKGEVRACRYCSAYEVCTQKDMYINQGLLK